MLRTYTTAKNNNLQREFHCCHNISIFLVSLYLKKKKKKLKTATKKTYSFYLC